MRRMRTIEIVELSKRCLRSKLRLATQVGGEVRTSLLVLLTTAILSVDDSCAALMQQQRDNPRGLHTREATFRWKFRGNRQSCLSSHAGDVKMSPELGN